MFPLLHFTRAGLLRRRCRTALGLTVLALLPLSLSCARLPPSVSGFTGRRLRVTMTFAGTMQPTAYYYYFLINKYGPTGTSTAHGPLPVFDPNSELINSIGNGYATGSGPGSKGTITDLPDYGITDFVLFNSTVKRQNNIGLYHYTVDPNTQQYPPNPTSPFNVTVPSYSGDIDVNSSASKTLQFDLYISQLVTDTTDQTAKNQEAQQIRYLQVNIVATNVIPITPDNVNKQVDAFGDTAHPNNQQFLTIDLTQNKTYTPDDNVSTLQEPTGDVYPPGSNQPSLDLVSWSIQVIPN